MVNWNGNGWEINLGLVTRKPTSQKTKIRIGSAYKAAMRMYFFRDAKSGAAPIYKFPAAKHWPFSFLKSIPMAFDYFRQWSLFSPKVPNVHVSEK